MRVLVIGRTGQVAQSMIERGRAAGATVTALGRGAVDLADPATLAPAFDSARPDLVVNAAAYTAVDAAETDETAAHALNAEGPAALAALCAKAGVPLIHISTDYVFDGTLDRPYREDDPTGPQGAYGRTKLAGENAVLASGADALVARTAWVYSPFGKNFVRTILRLGAEREELAVVDDQRGNPTSALDIADAILALGARRARWPSGASLVHLTAPDEATWHAFAEAIFAASPHHPKVNPIPTAAFPTPAKRPANSRLATALLAERYGLMLPSWRESLPPIVKRLLHKS